MRITTIILALTIIVAIGCKETPERPGAILDENYEPIVPTNTNTNLNTTDPNAPNAAGEPAQNAAGVWHYTCGNGCAGGAGTAMACATCGSTLVHNTVYHNNPGAGAPSPAVQVNQNGVVNSTSAAGSITNPIIKGIDPPAGAPTAQPKAPEPPQNAAGVWHYTCSAGCAGGAGSAVACAGCGSTLVHNTAYHN